ncbi:DUF5686 and carboxypeptidase regulatory-like domain-containing protein [Sphingobacterium griseoflavum]|uniref:Membrane protein n=1 Tax=Sphingobacterium griseoflavum TaxID=1474952 RepID=A0ABQ3HZ53_9SPHI|nr:DUF5686 and carboxypeptidase regulatory-like domain-containing protein [Sphingobacterium griseoflavum]GHE34691.1 membrane protein [Sphingobacterium griseoflavum]
MKYVLILFAFFLCTPTYAQVTGTVVDSTNKPLAAVSVLVKNSYLGTATNTNGEFSFSKLPNENQTLIFKSLGYKTFAYTIDAGKSAMPLHIVLERDERMIEEVVVTNRENPALRIIKQAIRHREINANKIDKYQADFYSKGIMRMEKLPKKMAKSAATTFPGLDSTGSGIIYLSETVSKISFQKPDKLYEEIVASKLSGNDQGFSFNTAIGANFDFYSNTVNLGTDIISPIADNALSYYTYKLIDIREEDGQQVYQIAVEPKRDKEPVVNGMIYIVDDSWAIYAVDFSIPGYRTQQPILDSMAILQHYTWHAPDSNWTKSLQQLRFKLGFFGIKANGSYLQNFSNYRFVDEFPKGTFGNTLAKIGKGANLKDSTYWRNARPIELTHEERTDYAFKDSIQTVRNSMAYLDSVDRAANYFSPLSPITGYTYRNSLRHYRIEYLGLKNLSRSSFNPVQGFTITAALNATLGKNEAGPETQFNHDFQYAFSEKKLRFYADYRHRFNTKHYATLGVEFGNRVIPFNEGEGVLPLVNNISTLFFKDSYIQLYQREQLKLHFTRNIGVPWRLAISAAWAKRSPLYNNSNFSLFRKDQHYVSNNPLAAEDYETAAFSTNSVFEIDAVLRWAVGQKAIDRPDALLLLSDNRYPVLTLGFKNGLNLTDDDLSYQHLYGTISQTTTLGVLGTLSGKINVGKFFSAENIPLTDYKHFAGNQTHIGTAAIYDNNFLLLPYYSHSSNNKYLQLHAEHDFKGYIFNKVPLLQELQWGLIAGYHQLATSARKPYHEFTLGIDNIGWGKYRLFRLDYVRSLEGKQQAEGFIIGIKILNFLTR